MTDLKVKIKLPSRKKTASDAVTPDSSTAASSQHTSETQSKLEETVKAEPSDPEDMQEKQEGEKEEEEEEEEEKASGANAILSLLLGRRRRSSKRKREDAVKVETTKVNFDEIDAAPHYEAWESVLKFDPDYSPSLESNVSKRADEESEAKECLERLGIAEETIKDLWKEAIGQHKAQLARVQKRLDMERRMKEERDKEIQALREQAQVEEEKRKRLEEQEQEEQEQKRNEAREMARRERERLAQTIDMDAQQQIMGEGDDDDDDMGGF